MSHGNLLLQHGSASVSACACCVNHTYLSPLHSPRGVSMPHQLGRYLGSFLGIRQRCLCGRSMILIQRCLGPRDRSHHCLLCLALLASVVFHLPIQPKRTSITACNQSVVRSSDLQIRHASDKLGIWERYPHALDKTFSRRTASHAAIPLPASSCAASSP